MKTEFERWVDRQNYRQVYLLWWSAKVGFQARVDKEGWFAPQIVNVPPGIVTPADERRYYDADELKRLQSRPSHPRKVVLA